MPNTAQLWSLLNRARESGNQPAALAAGHAIRTAGKGWADHSARWQALAEFELLNPSARPAPRGAANESTEGTAATV